MCSETMSKRTFLGLVTGLTGTSFKGSERHIVDQILAEYLRLALCSLSVGSRPVYVSKLLNVVRDCVAPLWPELFPFREKQPSRQEQEAEGDLHPDRVRHVLDLLCDLRDVVDLGEGYWLPSPVRFVGLPKGGKTLVIGGLSTMDLRRRFSPHISTVGLSRAIPLSALASGATTEAIHWQRFEDWCGDAPSDLRKWTETFLDEAQRRFRASAAAFTDFEVYAPWIRKSEPQAFRWLHFEEFMGKVAHSPPSVPLLCRSLPQRRHMPRKFWVGQVGPSGLLMETEALQLPEVRRLAYGMDYLYGAPTFAVWESAKTLILRSWLPPEEHRFLTAIAHDSSLETGRLPLRLDFEPDWRPLVEATLAQLGVQSRAKEEAQTADHEA